jgi:hypothetical protein
MWGPERQGLVSDLNSCQYLGAHANAQYQILSGCNAPAPTQKPVCGHWDERCFGREILTPFSQPNEKVSAVTIGGMQDLGYVVDYGAAEGYTTADLSSSCRCNRRHLQGGAVPTAVSNNSTNATVTAGASTSTRLSEQDLATIEAIVLDLFDVATVQEEEIGSQNTTSANIAYGLSGISVLVLIDGVHVESVFVRLNR